MNRHQVPYARCDDCGKSKPEPTLHDLAGQRVCLDCSFSSPYTETYPLSSVLEGTEAPEGHCGDLRDDMIEILRLYADGDNWGPVNQHQTAHRWTGNSGPGWGPARRLLKRHKEEERE